MVAQDVKVRWPSGQVETFHDLSAGPEYQVREEDMQAHPSSLDLPTTINTTDHSNRLWSFGRPHSDTSQMQKFPATVQDILSGTLQDLLKSLLLDTKNRVLAIRTVSIGDLSSSIVHPREVFKDAVVASAAALIVAHNHPSGDPTPSGEDVAVTKRLISAGEIMGIDLLDHIVIGDGVFVSLKERGLI